MSSVATGHTAQRKLLLENSLENKQIRNHNIIEFRIETASAVYDKGKNLNVVISNKCK
jgi:hypothetical protein